MPELPEVEIVARSLGKLVTGRLISDAVLLRERLSPETSPSQFAGLLQRTSILTVGRRGKHILIALDNGRTLIVHLRMSGRFSLLKEEDENPKFTHAIFNFEYSERLVFDDQRHFGMMKIVSTDRLGDAKELAKLAPEPFSDEFSLAYFRNCLSRSSRNLKEFLIDQTKVCGLGNIYASEAMFAARVDPRQPANRLSAPKARRLFDSIRAVLSEAIGHDQLGPIDPANIEGGYFSGSQGGWLVYGREGEPCRVCGSAVKRLKQGGRSTYFCPKCQRR